MPLAKTQIVRNNFTRGLITEATALSFPENAALDIDNFVIKRDGSLVRRLGLGIEVDGVVLDSGKSGAIISGSSFSTFKWKNVNNNPRLTITVLQIGNKLWFIDTSKDVSSANILNQGSPLSINKSADPASGKIAGQATINFSSTAGVLVIASKELNNPQFIQYSTADDSTVTTDIKLQVRDLWGVADGLEPDERPGTLSRQHRYNLLNQGWSTLNITKDLFTAPKPGTRALKELFPQHYLSTGAIAWPELTATNRVSYYKATRARHNGPFLRFTHPITGVSTNISHLSGLIAAGQNIYAQYGKNGNATASTTGSAKGYPANSDIPWEGWQADGVFNYDAYKNARYGFSNTVRGRYIIDAFDRGASRTAQTGNNLPTDRELGRISTVTAFANRVFYSGIDSEVFDKDEGSPDYTGTLFFSQFIESFKDLPACYQETDPTSEDLPELVATDGGFIKITEAANILKLVPLRSALLVFASNGVWEIKGVDGVFRATEYAINQITNTGAVNYDSIVLAQDLVFYWSVDGINVITPNQNQNGFVAQSLSETTIQSLYDNIPNGNKFYVKGSYDETSRKVKWLYSDEEPTADNTNRHLYNKELVFDLLLNSFYINTFATSTEGKYVSGYLPVENFTVIEKEDTVVNNEDVVEVNGEAVVTTSTFRANKSNSFDNSTLKYIVVEPDAFPTTYGFSFYEYNDSGFLDWGETDAAAYLVTGYETGGDFTRDKWVPYLTMMFNQTETGFNLVGEDLEATNPSSCLVQARWDWSDSDVSGKFGSAFQAYRLNRNYIPTGVSDDFDYGYSVVTTKTKLRGNGKALSLKFSAEEGQDCQILGWQMVMLGESDV